MMTNTTRFLLAVTAVNAMMLASTALMTTRTARAQEPDAQRVQPTIRTHGLQIVDDQGRVRAAIVVLPASTSAHGDHSPEMVLLRLITEQGRPSVKISASEEASGLSFAGPTGTTDTYTILEAKGKASFLRLRNEDGKESIVKP
ncbi:MAG TPA: hypothetical protein VGI97_12965 [Gemmatimonadaceae bacterium]|jgi:hypothetical protein